MQQPLHPPVVYKIVRKGQIDVNETIDYPATNNFGSDNVGIFPNIDFTTEESFLEKDNNNLTTTETGNNNLNQNNWDNVDVNFSQYFDEDLLASHEFMNNHLKQNFGLNNLQFAPLVIINNVNTDNQKWKVKYGVLPDDKSGCGKHVNSPPLWCCWQQQTSL